MIMRWNKRPKWSNLQFKYKYVYMHKDIELDTSMTLFYDHCQINKEHLTQIITKEAQSIQY